MAIGSSSWTTLYPATNFSTSTKAYSIAGWVYAATPTTSKYSNFAYLETGLANSVGNLYISWDHSGGLTACVIFVGDLPANPTYTSIALSPPANTWTHLAAVFNGTQILGYKNGSQVGSTQSVQFSTALTTLKPRVTQGGANGYGADFGFWNAALTATEIAALGKGFSAASIRPTSQFFFAPHVRDQVDWRAGALTGGAGNAATVHPRIYAP